LSVFFGFALLPSKKDETLCLVPAKDVWKHDAEKSAPLQKSEQIKNIFRNEYQNKLKTFSGMNIKTN
jgi:hypothetical protein